jgi:endonuclease YncB( thermonuclease family)
VRITQTIFLLCFICSCNSTSLNNIPNHVEGKVIAVKDGDTIEILFEGKPLNIRFEHVDCPEIKKKQPFGKAAKQFTSDLCFGQMVTVLNQKKFDRYKRLIGVVINESGQNINKELVKAGLAWHFKKYSTDQEYATLEIIARQNKVGIWTDNNPTPPWEWRKP